MSGFKRKIGAERPTAGGIWNRNLGTEVQRKHGRPCFSGAYQTSVPPKPNDNGTAVEPPEVNFQGSYSVDGDQLILTQQDGGDTIVLTWTRTS